MVLILVVAVLAMAAVQFRTSARLRAIEAELRELRTAPSAAPPEPVEAPPPPAPARVRAPARIVAPPPPPPPDQAEPAPARSPAPSPEPAGFSWESLIGARLPIWIGGVALVLAGFFLVRYSLENGLLGPGARVVLAAVFGAALIAASEWARRSRWVADDPRLGQALAGAGVASLYGTLYMAGELYGLIGLATSLVLLVAVTALALSLSLRQGPPTAVMGLIGGFAAPLVTGYDEGAILPLLLYLALFTAGLFALAIARGWAWLALAAAGCGFGWSLWLIGAVEAPAANAIAPFILALAVGGALALPRTGRDRPLIRLAPLALGLVQLALLGLRLEFSVWSWAFYAALAAACLALPLRDPRLRVAPLVAGVLALGLLAIALVGDAPTAPAAAIGFALLFGGAGQALLGRTEDRPLWAGVALAGAALPILLARILALEWLGPTGWIAPLALAAAAAGAVAWRLRHRAVAGEALQLAAPLVAATLALVAIVPLLPNLWAPALIAAAMPLLALWAMRIDAPRAGWLPAFAWIGALVAAWPVWLDYTIVLTTSLFGHRTPYRWLPEPIEAGVGLAIPAAIALALWWRDRGVFGAARWPVMATVGAIAIWLGWHAMKLPLAIATPEAFAAWGFVERAAITQAAFAAAGLAARFGWRGLAWALALLALGRIAWFDLLVLDPLWVRQAVGPWPVLNAAVLHAAAAAGWLWWLGRTMPLPMLWRRLSLAATLLTLLVLVRQATHGNDLTGPFGRGETWLYSAALIGLAVAWLLRGIRTGARDLRIAGLALVTVATLKVFLVDAAALDGLLRILSFVGLGLTLLAIGPLYRRVLRTPATAADSDPPADPAPA